MNPQEPPIFTASYDLACRIFEETLRFPKAQRFVIAQWLQNAVLTVLESVVSAYTKREKKPSLEQASEALERLCILVRLAHDLGFLTQKKADPLQQKVDEIGRMLGGWIKAEQKGQAQQGPRGARRLVEQQPEQHAVREPQQQHRV